MRCAGIDDVGATPHVVRGEVESTELMVVDPVILEEDESRRVTVGRMESRFGEGVVGTFR